MSKDTVVGQLFNRKPMKNVPQTHLQLIKFSNIGKHSFIWCVAGIHKHSFAQKGYHVQGFPKGL